MCLLGLPQDTWPLRSHMPIWYVSLPGTGWHCLSVVWSSRVASDPAWGVVQGSRCLLTIPLSESMPVMHESWSKNRMWLMQLPQEVAQCQNTSGKCFGPCKQSPTIPQPSVASLLQHRSQQHASAEPFLNFGSSGLMVTFVWLKLICLHLTWT